MSGSITPTVVCVGVITMDTVALVDRYPDADDRVLATTLVRNGGGPAAVASVTLARLGIPVAIVGTVGDDEDGADALRILQREGVNTEGVSVVPGMATAASVIIVSGAHRAISTRQPPTQPYPSDRARALVANADWVHVDHVGVKRLGDLGVSRGSGPHISLDAGYDVETFDVSSVDLFAPTDRQMAARHPGLSLAEAITADQKRNRGLVVATAGSDGSLGSDGGPVVSAAGFDVDVVSTLGAGDVFHGALVAQVVQGRPLVEALERANAVAALSCRGLDGQSAIPTATELEQFLSTHKEMA